MAIDVKHFDHPGGTGRSQFGGEMHHGKTRLTVVTLDGPGDGPAGFDVPRQPQNQAIYESHCESVRGGSMATWYGLPNGTKSIRKAMDKIMAEGWEDGVKAIEKLKVQVSSVMPAPVSRKRKLAWTEDGDEFDRDRLMNGQLDTMWRKAVRQFNPNPQSIAIGFSLGGYAELSSEQLFWTGAAALAVTDLLEDAGYNVDLYAFETRLANSEPLHGQVGTALTVIPLHKAGDPVNLSDLAAVAAHAGYFRTYVMDLPALMDKHQLAFGHGMCCEPHCFLPFLESEGLVPKVDVFMTKVYDEAAAKACVKEALVTLAGGDPDAVID